MNIDNLTGIEFEQLCKKLLEEYGFRVETTKASGDGGIDLIAYSDKIFYKGKYIIQCKRYVGSVGEPVIRDLYGVVTAERANKGILITSGSFTDSAIKFSENKPLELIDLLSLNKILCNDIYNDNDVCSNESILDMEVYNYYLNQISDSKCDYTTIIKFMDFILYNIIDNEAENQQQKKFENIRGCFRDLNEIEFEKQVLLILNEINSVNILKPIEQKLIYTDIVKNIELGLIKLSKSKFCRTKFGELYYRDIDLKYGGITQLLALDIESYFEERLKFMDLHGGLCFRDGFSMTNYFNRFGQLPSNCELFNVYSLCNYLGYDKGFEKLNNKYPRNSLFDSEFNFNNIDYQNIIKNKIAVIIYPKIHLSNTKRREISKSYYNRINFTSYFDSFISEESRKEIIKKIDFLLSI